jgi:hypothetical protein
MKSTTVRGTPVSHQLSERDAAAGRAGIHHAPSGNAIDRDGTLGLGDAFHPAPRDTEHGALPKNATAAEAMAYVIEHGGELK